jgi:hemerythrin
MGENRVWTGHLELDDQHLMLIQCFNMVKLGITGKEDLDVAVSLLWDTLEFHLNAEGWVLWKVLTPEKPAAHQAIHDAAIKVIREYWRTPDPGHDQLQRILEMIYSHMYSPEEEEMLALAREAVKTGQLLRHT